ncbi:MAG TPA: hypothetical protein VJB94_02715 [Candidatus Nanoarchaeia archaeon]|nr:hypothetical protein [Candidatus Nanoarchaeia archaeon]
METKSLKANTLGLATTMATKKAPIKQLKIVQNKKIDTCTINQF